MGIGGDKQDILEYTELYNPVSICIMYSVRLTPIISYTRLSASRMLMRWYSVKENMVKYSTLADMQTRSGLIRLI